VRDNAAPCRFMDSAALFPDMPRAHDRIHPTMQAREDWAVRVLSWLARQRRPTERQAWELARP
ncbi:MAG TPA: SGNH/GDSL hydrolase family protein, partial [Polyangiaceae bacterium]